VKMVHFSLYWSLKEFLIQVIVVNTFSPEEFSVNISFPSCISLIAVSLSFVAVSIFFFSYSISVIAVYPLILSKDLNYCLGLGLKGSDYDD
jgi:hypothetical protein